MLHHIPLSGLPLARAVQRSSYTAGNLLNQAQISCGILGKGSHFVKEYEPFWIFEIVKRRLRDPCGNGCRRASERARARQKLCARGKSRGQEERNILHMREREGRNLVSARKSPKREERPSEDLKTED
jgi:hypothetical protein